MILHTCLFCRFQCKEQINSCGHLKAKGSYVFLPFPQFTYYAGGGRGCVGATLNFLEKNTYFMTTSMSSLKGPTVFFVQKFKFLRYRNWTA